MTEEATSDEEHQAFPVGEDRPGTLRCKVKFSRISDDSQGDDS